MINKIKEEEKYRFLVEVHTVVVMLLSQVIFENFLLNMSDESL